MKKHGVYLLFSLAASLWGATAAMAQSAVDPALPVYQRQENLQGKITLVGSNTLSELAAVWGDSFRRLYPGVQVDVKVKGAVNAVPSVISGEATFGMLSRQITQAEVEAFHAKFGHVPTVLTPTLEPIAVYVHKDNPIAGLTLAQLDSIFSTSLKRGASKPAKTWGDLGLSGPMASLPIVVQTRNEATGSQVFFQTVIMGGGEFRPDAKHHASNLEMVKAIAADPRAIGFAGAAFDVDDVKAVPLAWTEQDQHIALQSPGYPLLRPLQIVVNRAPGKPLSPVELEFIKYIFSQRGQQDALVSGFVPVPARPAQIALDAIGVQTLN